MERLILQKLLDWKNSPYRKPLILKGVRQVGKTWVLKELGSRCYENTAYFNFDENEDYKQFFETENFVLQTLMTQFEAVPRYWTQSNPPYEVDFLIQRENDIFPVEVKSESNTSSRSLKKFKELFPEKVKLRVRFSLDNLKLDDDVLNIPLFMGEQADRLIGLALEQKKA